jgi:hypothetical protein
MKIFIYFFQSNLQLSLLFLTKVQIVVLIFQPVRIKLYLIISQLCYKFSKIILQ